MTHRWLGTALMLMLAIASSSARAQEATGPQVSSALYVRNDSDGTTVITPRLAVGAALNEATRLDVVYTVDVWTSASVDIRVSASKPVTEQRDEIDVSVSHALSDITLGGSYRYSTEYDYESHGGTLGGSYDFADNNATLALSLRAFFDQIGRAGDPAFQKSATTLGARASFTQVIDAQTVAQGTYEFGLAQGYLSSPYRFVRFATDDDPTITTCVPPVSLCVPEENPDSRMRHAIGLIGRRALGETFSLGASYRLYFDDWSMFSHTVGVEGAWTFGERWIAALGYRLYTQNSVAHYRPSYRYSTNTAELPASFTRDKELSALMSHRLELEVTHAFPINDEGGELNAVLLVAPAYYSYSDFPLLDHITAIEATVALEVRL